ncbi:MAG: ABC transporter permease [Anaerolineales bacterium]
MLATSMSANQFILGKVFGIVMVIFTQLASWLIFLVAGFYGARAMLDYDWLDSATFDLGTILILVLVFIPAFLFIAGIALTISSSVTEATEGQQAVGMISMPIAFSYWFAALIVANPGSSLSIGLSTASIGILVVSAVFTIWLAARAYEMGMMQYGKRIRLGQLLRSNGNGK